jgi:hypothetical protein
MISMERPTELDRHARIECDIRQDRFDLRRIEIKRLEKREPALKFQLLIFDHACNDVPMSNDRRACRLERGLP